MNTATSMSNNDNNTDNYDNNDYNDNNGNNEISLEIHEDLFGFIQHFFIQSS